MTYVIVRWPALPPPQSRPRGAIDGATRRSTGVLVDEHSPRSRSAFVHVQVSVTRLGHGHKRYEQHGFKPR